jgi:hypothetical protein
MNLADAEIAEELASSHGATVEAVVARDSGMIVRCLRQFVPSAVRRPQSPLNRVEIDPFTVGIASVTGETSTRYIGRLTEALLSGLFFYAKFSITNRTRYGPGPLFLLQY